MSGYSRFGELFPVLPDLTSPRSVKTPRSGRSVLTSSLSSGVYFRTAFHQLFHPGLTSAASTLRIIVNTEQQADSTPHRAA